MPFTAQQQCSDRIVDQQYYLAATTDQYDNFAIEIVLYSLPTCPKLTIGIQAMQL